MSEKENRDMCVFQKGMERLHEKHRCLRLDVDWSTVVAVISCLQLSCRHPGNRGEAYERAVKVVAALIATIEGIDPPLAEFLRRGDRPEHDVPT